MIFFGIILLVFTHLFAAIRSQDTRGFRQFLDPGVNPCEDFYQYACGKWTPLNIEAVDVITDQKMENRITLKQHFRSLRQRSNPASVFYQLCVNSKLQSGAEVQQPYVDALLEISQWPYLNESFDSSSFDWLQVAANVRRYRVDTLFHLSVQRNWKDSSQHLLYLTPSRKQFDGPADGDAAFIYKTYVKYLLLSFGVRVRKANRIAQEVVDFEVELDKLNRVVEDVLVEPISLSSLVRQVPSMNMKLYFDTLLGEAAKHSQMLVVQVDLLKKLETLLVKINSETIALFMLTRFLRHYQVKMDPPDWISCIEEVNAKMPLLVSKNFLDLRRTFTKSKVNEVFENIRDEFKQQINETSWYDFLSKNEVQSKLEAIRILIGYPDIQTQPDEQIDRQSYHKSRMLLDKQSTKTEFDLLKKPSETSNKNLRPLNVNAYYRLTTNTLEVPIGILQPPMYREDSNVAQIMGSLGSIIAHELVHGFDYDGQNYDKSGNVKMESKPKDIIQFGLRANCYIDQYSGGKVAALNEDIADNEGLRLAYGAYEKLRAGQPFTDSRISGDQLFFVSFAQIWCHSETSANKVRNHSTHRDRVNNVVSNSEEFAQAFSCRRGSKLNPVKKCQIW